MKVRLGFITNSSSSCYIVLYECNFAPELCNWIKEQYGIRGLNNAIKHIIPGDKVAEHLDRWGGLCGWDDFDREEGDLDTDLPQKDIDSRLSFDADPTKHYLVARFIDWSCEDDHEGFDAELAREIPKEYLKEIVRWGAFI